MAAGKNQVIGQVRLKSNGQLFDTDGQATLDLGGVKRDPVEGDYQAGAFRESQAPSKCEFSVLIKPGVSLAQIGAIKDETLTFEADTGHVYVIAGAWNSETLSINQSDGKAKCVFMGPPAEEMKIG